MGNEETVKLKLHDGKRLEFLWAVLWKLGIIHAWDVGALAAPSCCRAEVSVEQRRKPFGHKPCAGC